MMLRAVVLEENTSATANDDEIKLYASSIGIDLHKEPDLLSIAKEGISAALPTGWQILQDENNRIFYYNSASGQSLWEHPLDRLYRQRVEEARVSKQTKMVPLKRAPATIDPASGRSSCSTPTTQNHEVSDRRDSRDKNTDASTNVPPSTPRFDSFQKGSTHLDDKPVHPEWANAPLLGDKIATPRRAENTVPTGSASESEVPTEYCELVRSHMSSLQTATSASGHRRHTVLLGDSLGSVTKSTTTQTASCQTDQNEDPMVRKAERDWTLQHCASLGEADRRLTWLQSKLRQSLLVDNQTFLASPIGCKDPQSIWPRRSASLLNSPRHKLPTPTTTATNVTKPQLVVDLDNSLTQSPARFRPDRPSDQGPCPALASPPCRDTRADAHPPAGPQVGVSPSDSTVDKSGLPNPKRSSDCGTPSRLKIGVQQGCTQTESRSCRQVTGVLLERGQLEQHRLIQSAPVPFVPDAMPGISVGMSHLAEERARLQRKILRLKVIYKSYKQRLASLDSTILLLQQSSTTVSGGGGANTSKYLDHRPSLPEQDYSTHRDSPLSDTCPSPRTVHRAQNVGSVSSESSASTCRADSQGPEIIDIQEQSEPLLDTARSVRKPRRSVSVPRQHQQQPVATVHHHSVSRSHGIKRSVSQDLAASLASIDAQLHHVLYQLEPTCAVDDHGDADCARRSGPGKTPTQCLRRNGYSGSPSAHLLQRGLANLSLSDHYGGASGLGDLRLLTPVSPDCGPHERFQKPQVDVSPTWLQSD